MPPPAEGADRPAASTGIPWAAAAPILPQPPIGSTVADPNAPRTTTTPTMRDRAYTFVMQLPVTRVRDMCREAGLKQFGKKAESQPRLFWGACASANNTSDPDAPESWAGALPGLREWLAAPHRDHATVWLAAPPQALRPHNFHSFYASPSLAARRQSAAGTPPAPKVTPVDDEREEPDAALGDGEMPTLRDKVYTYVRSLPVTLARRYCKALGLKQFGVKRDSQLRLFWNWAIVTESPALPPTLDAGATLPPAPVDTPLPGLDDFVATAAPERWLRAPDDTLRPDAVGLRVRERSASRRKKFGAHELARLLCALVRPELRGNACAVLAARIASTPDEEAPSEAAFWTAAVAPVFNDASFAPRLALRMSGEAHVSAPPPAPRNGEELRKYFDDVRPAFARAYRRWHVASAPPDAFDNYLRERRPSVPGAPLSPTEKRATIFFAVLRCGAPDEYSDFLTAILADEQEYPTKEEQVLSDSHINNDSVNTISAPPLDNHDVSTANQPVLVDNPPPAPPVSAPVMHHMPVARPIAPAHVTVSRNAPLLPMVPPPVTGPQPTLIKLAPQPPAPLVVQRPFVGAAAGEPNGGRAPMLGKRARVSLDALADEVDVLRRRIDDAVSPEATMRRNVLRAEHEKAVMEAIVAARHLRQDLANDDSADAARLRAANDKKLARLTKEMEANFRAPSR